MAVLIDENRNNLRCIKLKNGSRTSILQFFTVYYHSTIVLLSHKEKFKVIYRLKLLDFEWRDCQNGSIVYMKNVSLKYERYKIFLYSYFTRFLSCILFIFILDSLSTKSLYTAMPATKDPYFHHVPSISVGNYVFFWIFALVLR